MIRVVVIGLADGRRDRHSGRYLVNADVNVPGGIADLTTTSNPELARAFATTADAVAYWQRISSVRPRRPDGLPNRPFAAYTIVTEHAPG